MRLTITSLFQYKNWLRCQKDKTKPVDEKPTLFFFILRRNSSFSKLCLNGYRKKKHHPSLKSKGVISFQMLTSSATKAQAVSDSLHRFHQEGRDTYNKKAGQQPR